MPAFLPSELPLRSVARPSRVTLFTPPHKWWCLALVVLVLAAWIWVNPMLWVLLVVLAVGLVSRWLVWRVDKIFLTGKRVIRTSGIPEITKTETSLRIDRISGLSVNETFWGNIWGYATIVLEVPGEHPGLRKLERIVDAHEFYLELRALIFDDPGPHTDDFGDPDGPVRDPGRVGAADRRTDTSPLPPIDRPPADWPPAGPSQGGPPRDRFGRRQDWER